MIVFNKPKKKKRFKWNLWISSVRSHSLLKGFSCVCVHVFLFVRSLIWWKRGDINRKLSFKWIRINDKRPYAFQGSVFFQQTTNRTQTNPKQLVIDHFSDVTNPYFSPQTMSFMFWHLIPHYYPHTNTHTHTIEEKYTQIKREEIRINNSL